MTTAYKGRTAIEGTQAEVYYNIKKNMFSVRQECKVVLHADTVIIAHAEFKVNEAGRQRVLDSHRKNVHATISGLFLGTASKYDIQIKHQEGMLKEA